MASDKAHDTDFKNISDWVYLAAAIALLLVALWFVFRTPLVWLLLHLREPVLHLVGLVAPQAEAMASDLARIGASIKPSTMEFGQFKLIAVETGRLARWPWFLGAMGFVAYGLFQQRNSTRKLTPESLAKSEMEVWPEITPVVGLKLTEGDITKGPWAVSLTEREFAKRHKLLDDDGNLNRQKAHDVFVRQLGPIWRGPEALPPYARGLFACFLLSIVGDRAGAIKYLRQMAREHGPGAEGSHKNIDFTFADAIIDEHRHHKTLRLIESRHAYSLTVLASMLQASRSGVLASSLFVWLRPVDRRLWYTLNSVGRYRFAVESSGVMSHWLHEKTVGERTIVPMVNEAVLGLEEALGDFIEENNELDRLH